MHIDACLLKRVAEAMATNKMEKIEKLKDEMTRASLVRCQAASHASKLYLNYT